MTGAYSTKARHPTRSYAGFDLVDKSVLVIARNRLQSHIADLKDTIWYLESRIEWFAPDEIEAVDNWIALLKQKLAESCDDLRELDH